MGTIFSRTLNESMVKNLLNEKLWNEKLKPDCLDGKVFMALRDNYISFYHEGGNLFNYRSNRFETHIKHVALLDVKKSSYVIEKHLENAQLIKDFFMGYNDIKNNCKLYAKKEEFGLSNLYQKFSYSSKHNSNVVVLDIQVSFSYEEEETEKNKQDRIDILLLNKNENKLRFIEAKLASNPDIVADPKYTPSVIGQIDRYRRQIDERESELINAYKIYADTVNVFFDNELLPATDLVVDKQVGLLIFDFDDDIKERRLAKHVINNPRYINAEIPVCLQDEITRLTADNLWDKTN